MSDDLGSDDLAEVVSEIETRAVAARDDLFADRQPWSYLGWMIFCQASETSDGKPIALRAADIKAVRPAAPGRCGLTMEGLASTVMVYGEFMDIIDMVPLDPPMFEFPYFGTPPPLPVNSRFMSIREARDDDK